MFHNMDTSRFAALAAIAASIFISFVAVASAFYTPAAASLRSAVSLDAELVEQAFAYGFREGAEAAYKSILARRGQPISHSTEMAMAIVEKAGLSPDAALFAGHFALPVTPRNQGFISGFKTVADKEGTALTSKEISSICDLAIAFRN